MKRIDWLLVGSIVVMVILICIKLFSQEVIVEKDYSKVTETEEQIKYEANRMLNYGEKGIYSEYSEEGKKVNISSEMKKEQLVEDGVMADGFNVEYKNGYTNIMAIVKNNTNEVKGGYDIELVLFDDEGNDVGSFNTYLNKIQPGEDGYITSCIPGDLSDAYKFEIRKIEEEK